MQENILIALEIMWKGMAGVFAATLVIMATVWVINKFSK